MIVRIFTAVSVLGAAIYYFALGLAISDIWKALIAFFVFFLASNAVCFVMLWIFSLINKPDGKKQSGFCRRWCVHVATLALFYLRVRAHISGEEKIPEGRFLFVSNHRSAFDPLSAIVLLAKYNVAFITKPENLKIPVFGPIAAGDCYLPINRDNDREALRTVIKAAELIKNDVCSVAIYPEGTRSRTGKLLPFKAGAFKIAQKAKAPVVVAACRGTDRAMKIFRPGRADVYLDIVGVISAEDAANMQTTEISAMAEKMISDRLKETE